jgi:hypothetical protein
MKTIHLLPLALILPVLIIFATPADASRGDYLVSFEKSSVKYGEPFQYTITFSGSRDPDVNHIQTRIINKVTGMASEWSDIMLDGTKTQVTTDIIGAPFDKKGTYILQTIYSEPKLMSHGGGEFELLDDADPETSQGTMHFLSIPEQFNAQIQYSDIVCKQGLQLEERIRNGPVVCIKPEHRDELLKRGFIHDPSTEPEGLAFERLKNTYKESEPIAFALWFKGMADHCSFATMHIFDSAGTRIWSLDEPDYNCSLGEAPEYLEKDFGPVLYEQPILPVGKYKAVANFENQEIEKEIIVK